MNESQKSWAEPAKGFLVLSPYEALNPTGGKHFENFDEALYIAGLRGSEVSHGAAPDLVIPISIIIKPTSGFMNWYRQTHVKPLPYPL